MIRLIVEINRRRCGSLFLHDDNAVEFHARDHAAFLEALALAVSALNGRDHIGAVARNTRPTDGEKGECGTGGSHDEDFNALDTAS